MRRCLLLPAVVALAMALAACGGDAAPTTTTTTAPTTTTTTTIDIVTTTTAPPTTTTTTLPAGPPIAEEGDKNEIVAALQFLLNCGGHGDLEVDGNFGPMTKAAVEAAQGALARAVTGAPDEETFADLARACDEPRMLEGEGEFIVVGNAAPEDPDLFGVSLPSGGVLGIAVVQGGAVEVAVLGEDDAPIPPADGTTWEIETPAELLIEVSSEEGPLTFALTVEVRAGERLTGDWILATDGVIYKGTKLALGSNAQAVIDKVFQFLGHGVRGAYNEFDTGWYSITDPGDMGLRGIFIEGFAFLFFGPDPNNPGRPETFERHRFEGPGVDAAGNPRPEGYATTAEGITVGDTLAELVSVYGTRVRAGSNEDEHWYRYADSRGELCFYFDTEDAPKDSSPIVEIASECRR